MGNLLVEAISHLSPKSIDPSALGALKLLHKPKEEAGYKKAKERMKQEVDALSRINHPNILQILDQDLEQGWFVGEYHLQGPLSMNQDRYKGNMLRALEVFKPLVERRV